MAIKNTIAIVEATGKTGREIVAHFSSIPYRLLLVSNKLGELNALAETLKKQRPVAEIETLECVKDSCWEADIIILTVASDEEKQVAELMKEVATQKIVVAVLEEENECDALEKVLPYSKIVKAFINIEISEIVLSGKDETVNKEIAAIFNSAGYETKVKEIKL